MGRLAGSYEVDKKGKKKLMEASKPAAEVDGSTTRLKEQEAAEKAAATNTAN